MPTLKIGERVAYKAYFKQKKFHKIKFVQTDPNQGQKGQKNYIFFAMHCIYCKPCCPYRAFNCL